MRINKFISQSGYCSRRQADELIRQGKVLLNNQPVKEMGTQVNPDTDTVRIKKGPTLKPSKEKVLIMLNKPKGYTCTKKDPHAKRTVYELLPEEYQNLFSIGRLDKDSEGLLLFTNDGDLSQQLTHPKFGKEKVYLVTVRGKMEEKEIALIEKGMRLRLYRIKPAKVSNVSYDPEENKTQLKLTIKEGKKRQIREMFLALKHPVKILVRISFGKYKLRGMKVGEWMKIKN